MYEHFEHTADLGLRVTAPDLPRLFEDAAAGLFAMIVEPLPRTGDWERALRVEGERYDYLLVDWLSELLYLFESERVVLGRFDVCLDGTTLAAKVGGEPLDATRGRLLHEVKAITYHGLTVERSGDGWLAEVIVDI